MLSQEYINNEWNRERAERLLFDVRIALHGLRQVDVRVLKVLCYTLYKLSATNNPFAITWYDVVDGEVNISENAMNLLKDECFSGRSDS